MCVVAARTRDENNWSFDGFYIWPDPIHKQDALLCSFWSTKVFHVVRFGVFYNTLPTHCCHSASKVNLSMKRLRRVTISLNIAVRVAYNWTANFPQGLLEKTPGKNRDCLWLSKEGPKKSLRSHKRDDDWPSLISPTKKLLQLVRWNGQRPIQQKFIIVFPLHLPIMTVWNEWADDWTLNVQWAGCLLKEHTLDAGLLKQHGYRIDYPYSLADTRQSSY